MICYLNFYYSLIRIFNMLSKQEKMTIGLVTILGVVLLLLCITIPTGLGGEIGV
jgi:hypothetical protein